ncbi:unnamed protein product [Hymenolepis diminuta]|uniref:Uncharacterized protein n=1 Tax=Hymenolepis diminuta TaxID=6216 RepID=A0A564YDI7_HYMDI|nr:unnamed protein product [Hymenolepis diminuta]
MVFFGLLNRIEQELNITLSDITMEWHQTENLKDTVLIQNAQRRNQNFKSYAVCLHQTNSPKRNIRPSSGHPPAFWFCNKWYFASSAHSDCICINVVVKEVKWDHVTVGGTSPYNIFSPSLWVTATYIVTY